MDTGKITSALDRLFHEDGHRIVFWNDPDMEFSLLLASVKVAGVNTLRLDQLGAFEAKLKVEREHPTGKFLLYAPAEEPNYENDWLLDIRLYSRSFRADRASLLQAELGLVNQQLRQHIADRRKFFDNKDRLRKLTEMVSPTDTADDLDRKMLTVVLKADQAEFFTLVRAVFHAYLTDDAGDPPDLAQPPAVWVQAEKFDLDQSFWASAKTAFGYDDAQPTLKNFLIRLMVTDFAQHLKGGPSDALKHLVLQGKANTVVCLGYWRDSSSTARSYDVLSSIVAGLLDIRSQCQGREVETLIDVMTFVDAERAIMSGLRDRVVATADTMKAADIRQVATRRQAGHWIATATASDVHRSALGAGYDALVAAADFFELRNRYKDGFACDTAAALYRAYESDLYQFDQLYRHFFESADLASQGDLLKGLREKIEAVYVNGFLGTLALAWGKVVAPSGSPGLLDKWQIGHLPNQQRFFETQVKPPLKEGENRRVFVVISDAFRYEAAQELTTQLNGKYRLEATLSSQLGVLPSYTTLGMASLLPHKTLAYKPTGEVLLDGRPTASFEQRNAILGVEGGMAIKAHDLRAMKKDEGREAVRGKQVVYVYHNAVDVMGADAKSEKDTFLAVRRAIDELAGLVTYIINNLNGHHVLVTADHGFLFTESAPTETDKSVIPFKPDEVVKTNRRYLLGQNLPPSDLAWHGKTSVTASAEGGMEFWIPRGMNRFTFTGATRYVHGGAMLQEIVVPVVLVKHRRDKAGRDETKVTTVSVHVLGSKHKITTAQHRFQLIQMEPVGERVRPITLRAAVYDGGEPVTNVETVTFDSTSTNMDERKKWVRLVLKDGQYDRKKLYRLVIRDAETDVEHQSIDVNIDRAFSDDF